MPTPCDLVSSPCLAPGELPRGQFLSGARRYRYQNDSEKREAYEAAVKGHGQ